jgi:amidohydrolase
MHACGHDVHIAVLMGVAEVLAGIRADIPGTVKFIFQPAEEGAPAGEEGGARLMIKEGVLENPVPGAIFGLHVFPDGEAGTITCRPGAAMAGNGSLRIVVHGAQTHGAMPWGGTDPIVTSAQIITGLQTVVSRQTDITRAPVVVTIGIIRGGVRSNIIPDTVEMIGTIRYLDPDMRKEVYARIKRAAEGIAQSAGATAEVAIGDGLPATMNDPALAARMLPALERAAGKGNVFDSPPKSCSEDFSLFSSRVPGLFLFLGSRTPGSDPAKAVQNHSPFFTVDEAALPLGVKALVNMTMDYCTGK